MNTTVASTQSVANTATGTRLYGRLWRWHFFAAAIVIPFVLWQSTTGTLYLWSERWMDAAYPTLRFVKLGPNRVPLSRQIEAALRSADTAAAGAHAPTPLDSAAPSTAATPTMPQAAHPGHHHDGTSVAAGLTVQSVLVSDDPTRSTAVLLQHANGLPFPVFVDPYTGTVLGQLTATAWLPGITRALHGGWPLGEAGSWLLELGDGWAILMIATGLYLWWPRGRGLRALWPRLHSGKRVLVRDLHSCVAVWFSVVFLFFLVSALPWTAFWGGQLLTAIESRTGQSSPAGFSPGGATVSQLKAAAQPIEEVASAARAAGVQGTLDVRLAPWTDAPLFITNTQVLPWQDRIVVADARDGAIRGDYNNDALPAIPRFVALGVHVHQGDFGAPNVWLNTAFATSLVWLSVTGILSWWTRRPQSKLGAPSRVSGKIPSPVLAVGVVSCIVLPLLGASVLLLVLADACVERLRRVAVGR